MKGKKLFILISILAIKNFTCVGAEKRDTLALTVSDAGILFLQNNFRLIVAKYEMNAADAAIVQANLFPNPNLFIDQGAYNSETKKWFDITKTGETAASLEQVIQLAGKRSKQVEVAKMNSHITVLQFYDLIRVLRYELNTNFYSLYFLNQSATVYDNEIESLEKLIEVFGDQYKKGNVSFKELARLQSLQFNLQNERLDIEKDIAEKQKTLVLIIGDSLLPVINPVIEEEIVNGIDVSKINYEQLVDSAAAHRPDLQISMSQAELSESNYKLQKALRYPDLTIGANWDRQGSYITNYNSLSLAIDLPFWNRNQGNVKIAKDRLEESKELILSTKLQVKSEVLYAYNQLLETDKLYKTASGRFNSDYDKLLDGITKGYKDHTISLLEFIDYYETYKDSKTEYNKLKNKMLESVENINLVTGTTVIK